MTREQVQRALLARTAGYDADLTAEDYGMDLGADDPVKRAGLSTIQAVLSVANAASLAVNLFAQDDLDNVALPTGVTSINGSTNVIDYHRVIRYFQANPSRIHSILIQSSEASPAAVLSGMTITPTRKTPFGLTMQNILLVQSYQTTQDFQAFRVTVPLVMVLDSFSYPVFATGTNGSGATITFTLSLFFGQRSEQRAALRRGGTPIAIRPGGRGVMAVK